MTGNVLVVTAINFDPKLNTITNMLIQNLAFTDICMASLHMPFWVISLRYGRWVFNHVLCQLVGLTQLTFGITSLFTMTGIAFNRYFNVVRRNLYTKYFSTKKVTYFVIAAAWLGALLSPPRSSTAGERLPTTHFSRSAHAFGTYPMSLSWYFFVLGQFSPPRASFRGVITPSTKPSKPAQRGCRGMQPNGVTEEATSWVAKERRQKERFSRLRLWWSVFS